MKGIRLIVLFLLLVSSILLLESCSKDEDMIPVPMTTQFAQNLSTYNIYQGNPQDLTPAADYHLLELGASLFANYAEKQRLVKLPIGEQMSSNGDGIPTFPDGTILVKTFYYYRDARDTSLGKQVIETRLLIKELGEWNVATYVWNEQQTAAILVLDGLDTEVTWINTAGTRRSINYQVPDQNECVSCHQSNEKVLPIGPSLRNLNLDVLRNNVAINQLQHLQQLELINSFDIQPIGQIVNFEEQTAALAARGRAYLDMNCAHCHQPFGWRRPANERYDFRYETPIGDTRILDRKEKIKEVLVDGEMPYLGTTVLDQEGIALIIEYINSL